MNSQNVINKQFSKINYTNPETVLIVTIATYHFKPEHILLLFHTPAVTL